MLKMPSGNPQNLRVPTTEEARRYQALGVKKRLENQQKRNLLIHAGREIFNAKMDVTDKIKAAAKLIGYKVGRKATFGEVAYLTMMHKALKDGNYKAFTELARLSGMHFDQSPEALGGVENPINVAQTTTVAPEQVKAISEELEGGC